MTITLTRVVRDVLALMLGVPLVLVLILASTIDTQDLVNRDQVRQVQRAEVADLKPPVQGGL